MKKVIDILPPDCHEKGEPHDFRVEDFSDSEGGESYLKCSRCGKTKQ